MGTVTKVGFEIRRFLDDGGHEDHGPQCHRFSQKIVGVQAGHHVGAGAVSFGPAHKPVRLFHAALIQASDQSMSRSTHRGSLVAR